MSPTPIDPEDLPLERIGIKLTWAQKEYLRFMNQAFLMGYLPGKTSIRFTKFKEQFKRINREMNMNSDREKAIKYLDQFKDPAFAGGAYFMGRARSEFLYYFPGIIPMLAKLHDESQPLANYDDMLATLQSINWGHSFENGSLEDCVGADWIIYNSLDRAWEVTDYGRSVIKKAKEEGRIKNDQHDGQDHKTKADCEMKFANFKPEGKEPTLRDSIQDLKRLDKLLDGVAAKLGDPLCGLTSTDSQLHKEGIRDPQGQYIDFTNFPKGSKAKRTLLQRADALINGSRQDTYGDPVENWGRTAELMSSFLGTKIDAHQACVLMILVKVSRSAMGHHEDTLMDIAGYAALADIVGKKPTEQEG